MKKITLFFIFLIVSGKVLFAVSADPKPGIFTQPDGSTLTITKKGDEWLKFAVTEDGYTLMFDDKGFLVYAYQDVNGDMQPSQYVAKSIENRTGEERLFLQTITPGLFYSKSQMDILSQIREMRTRGGDSPQRAFPTTGARKAICILIGFTDRAFGKTNADFTNLLNQISPSYTTDGATGSVRSYFQETSYNQLDLTFDVFGPYTAANNMAYYGANDANGDDVRPGYLIAEACSLAYNVGGANYDNYDNDNDGYVDGLYVIYAGYGEENSGAPANCIWAHAWDLYSAYYYGCSPVSEIRLPSTGKRIHAYACSSELRGISGTNITRIGVICHEFGHTLGAPDFYDTDYATGGSYTGTGYWDLQANGSWNGSTRDGRTPAHPNPFTKAYIYNWATVTTLTSAATIQCQPSLSNKTAFYRIDTPTPNEFYLIENRQNGKSDFDANIPGSGLMIYHMHSNYENQIENNIVNSTHPQHFYPVCADRTTAILPASATSANYGTINGTGSSFPGSGNKTAFDGTTTPRMFQWTGSGTSSTGTAITNRQITNISRNAVSGVVTFDFMGGAPAACNAPTGLTVDFTTDCKANLSWTAAAGATSYNIYRDGSKIVSNHNGTTYQDASFSNATAHNWHVTTAACGGGSESGASNVVAKPVCVPCAPPTNLTVTYTATCEANLSWTAPAGAKSNITVTEDDNTSTSNEQADMISLGIPPPQIVEASTITKTRVDYQNQEIDPSALLSATNPLLSLSRGSMAYGNIIFPSAHLGYWKWDVGNITGKTLVTNSLPTLKCGEFYNGKLYAYYNVAPSGTGTTTFYIVDAYTGALESSTNVTTYPGYNVAALAYDYTTNTMFALIPNNLMKVNLTTGALTYINAISGLPTGHIALTLAIDANGIMYTVACNNVSANSAATLYQINKTTAAAAAVGATGNQMYPNAQSMNFDHTDGTLYWCHSNATSDNFMKINPATGVATMLQANTYQTNFLIFPTAPPKITLYNIYRDNVLIKANHPGTTYQDAGFNAMVGHKWDVTAVCDGGGESDPTTKSELACEQPVCNPPTNLQVAYTSDCKADLTWDTPKQTLWSNANISMGTG